MKNININTDLELTVHITQKILIRDYKGLDHLTYLREQSKWVMFKIRPSHAKKLLSYTDGRVITNTDMYFFQKKLIRREINNLVI